MILTSLKSGLEKTFDNKRMIAVFYLANLIFGLIIIVPLRAIIDDFVGYRLMGEKLAGRFDMDFLLELIAHENSFLSAARGMIFVIPLLHWIFLLFLSGGAFAIFASDEKYSAAMFWGNCAKYFGRYLRLALWSLPMLAILLAAPLVTTGLQRLIFGKEPYEYIVYWGGCIWVGLGFIGILIFGIVFDYSRIHTVQSDERTMRVSLWQGFRFAFVNFKYTFGLAALLFVIGGSVLAIYSPIANLFAAPNVAIVILMFLTQQLYMIFRMILRLTLYAGQLDLFRTLAPAPAPVIVPESNHLGMEGAATA